VPLIYVLAENNTWVPLSAIKKDETEQMFRDHVRYLQQIKPGGAGKEKARENRWDEARRIDGEKQFDGLSTKRTCLYHRMKKSGCTMDWVACDWCEKNSYPCGIFFAHGNSAAIGFMPLKPGSGVGRWSDKTFQVQNPAAVPSPV
jgi:hypothetical protein